MSTTIAGIRIPDSQLAREATDLVRDTETDLLFHHSRRVFLFGGFPNVSDADRAKVVTAHPRGEQFKQDIIEAFYQGIRHKPETTFGNVKADVLELKDPHFHRGNFCQVILNSAWPS